MIGNAVLVLKNGEKIEGEFIARAVIEKIDTSNPKISFFQAWGVRSFPCSDNLASRLIKYTGHRPNDQSFASTIAGGHERCASSGNMPFDFEYSMLLEVD
jgi:hypothetical protein